MATNNVLTALAPVLYKAAQIVPRELTGMAASVDTTFDAKEVAQGDVVKVPVISAGAAGDYTPAMTTTVGSGTTPTTVSVTMGYSREYTFNLQSEEERSLQNGGDNAKEYLRQNTEQGIRVLINEIDALLAVKAKEGASRACGTAAVTPFATTIDTIVDAKTILNVNGTPMTDRFIVLNSAASANLSKLVTINNQPAGSPAEEILRGGTLVNLHGFNIRESGNIAAHAVGTLPSGTLMTATEPVGETSIAFGTDTNGPWLAGDVVTLGSGGGSGTADTAKYVISAATTSSPFVLNSKGLLIQHVSGDTVTTSGAYTPSFAFHKSALKLVARPPIITQSPLIEMTMIGDPLTGLTFLFCRIVGDGVVTYRLNLCYGIAVVQGRYIATILG
jgi:hypothetical protein